MSDPQTLLPSSASRLEKALERALARQLAELPTPIRDAWNADVIELEQLPWLAWGVGKRTWNAEWPEAIRRSIVRTAIPTARRMGSVQSVRDIVAAFGGQLAIREWWELSPKGPPFTFSIVLTLNGQTGEAVTARFVEEVVAEISRAKPARAHFTFTQGLSFAGAAAIAGGVRPTVIRRLELEQTA
jgi:phage tail P2-like protein